MIEPKPVLPPGVYKLRRDAIPLGVFFARAVPQTSDAPHRENEIACSASTVSQERKDDAGSIKIAATQS